MSYAEAAKRYGAQSETMLNNTDRQPLPVANTSNDSENVINRDDSYADQFTENTEPVHTSGQNTKDFLNFDYNNFKAINVVQTKKTNIEEYDDLSCKLMTFVMGVLAAIDKSKKRVDAKDLICSGASDFLFEGEIQFRWKENKINKDI